MTSKMSLETPINGDSEMEVSNLNNEKKSCDQTKDDSSNLEIFKSDEFLENVPPGRFVTIALNDELKKEFGERSSPPSPPKGSFVTIALNDELKKEFGERSSPPRESEVHESCTEALPALIKEEPLEVPFESEVQGGYPEVLPTPLKEEPLDIPFEEYNSREYDLSLGHTGTLVSESIFSREARRNDFIVRGLMSVLHNAGIPVDFKSVASHLVSEVKDDNWSRRPVVRPQPSNWRREADVPKAWE